MGASALAFIVLGFFLLLSSCATAVSRHAPPPEKPVPVPERIMGTGAASHERLVRFLLSNNPGLDGEYARAIAHLYQEEAAAEGVNADVAFSQMCVETGFLRFGGLVTPDMNNFCGLGSIGPGQRGNSFLDARTGVRAHVQHLKAYASAEPLALPLVDPRYRYVTPKGKAPLIVALAGSWASDPQYGNKILNMLSRLYS